MNYETLMVENKYGVGIVWLNRPKTQNAYDETMIAELIAAIGEMADDPAVRAVIFAGMGESFCNGADLKWLQGSAAAGLQKSHADALNFAMLLQAIDTLKKPTVARVHGHVASGGVGLVAACDMAVAAYDAEFSIPDVQLGLVPAVIAPYLIRAMGERATRRYVLSAEPFSAAEAYRIGLLSDIAPMEELDARINDLLGRLIQGGPWAQSLSKEWLRDVASDPLNPDLSDAGALRMAEANVSEEGQGGIGAFVKKRRPAWVLQAEKAVKKAATQKGAKAAGDKKGKG